MAFGFSIVTGLRRIRSVAAGVLALIGLGLASSAGAVTIDYGVTQGSEPSFKFSFLHGASSNCCGAPAEYFNSGPKLFRLSGVLSGDFTTPPDRLDITSDVDLSATVLDASVPGASVNDVWLLRILAGSFIEEEANGRTSGELAYELYDNDDLAQPVATGTFVLFPEDSFPTSANRLSSGQVGVWANNWDNATESRPDTGDFFAALGIDMVGVPEPTGLALQALGFVALLRPLRRHLHRR
jgi:hypothetical protein